MPICTLLLACSSQQPRMCAVAKKQNEPSSEELKVNGERSYFDLYKRSCSLRHQSAVCMYYWSSFSHDPFSVRLTGEHLSDPECIWCGKHNRISASSVPSASLKALATTILVNELLMADDMNCHPELERHEWGCWLPSVMVRAWGLGLPKMQRVCRKRRGYVVQLSSMSTL